MFSFFDDTPSPANLLRTIVWKRKRNSFTALVGCLIIINNYLCDFNIQPNRLTIHQLAGDFDLLDIIDLVLNQRFGGILFSTEICVRLPISAVLYRVPNAFSVVKHPMAKWMYQRNAMKWNQNNKKLLLKGPKVSFTFNSLTK